MCLLARNAGAESIMFWMRNMVHREGYSFFLQKPMVAATQIASTSCRAALFWRWNTAGGGSLKCR